MKQVEGKTLSFPADESVNSFFNKFPKNHEYTKNFDDGEGRIFDVVLYYSNVLPQPPTAGYKCNLDINKNYYLKLVVVNTRGEKVTYPVFHKPNFPNIKL